MAPVEDRVSPPPAVDEKPVGEVPFGTSTTKFQGSNEKLLQIAQVKREVADDVVSDADDDDNNDAMSAATATTAASTATTTTTTSPMSTIDPDASLSRPAQPTSTSGASTTTTPTTAAASGAGDVNILLWQFLRELLIQGEHPDIIKWTSRDGEFKLLNAEAVALLWGERKAKPNMNYDKMSRALRYYYEKNIIEKVPGQKFVYRFVNVNEHAPSEGAMSYHPSNFQSPGAIKIEPYFGAKDDKDYEPQNSSATSLINSFSMSHPGFAHLSLFNPVTSTAASVSTPSPTDSSCSPNSVDSSPDMANATTTSPPGPSSRPSSAPHVAVDDTGKRYDDRATPSSSSSPSGTRKRGAVSPNVDAPPPRRSKPNPLNLSAATSSDFAMAAAISPLFFLPQNSPLLQPALNHLCALASASFAGFYGPQLSPMFAASPFRSPLATPMAGHHNAVPSSQSQVFQFPPTSNFGGSSLVNPFSSLISPVAPFMMSNMGSTQFKYPSTESLKTPTVPLKLPTL